MHYLVCFLNDIDGNKFSCRGLNGNLSGDIKRVINENSLAIRTNRSRSVFCTDYFFHAANVFSLQHIQNSLVKILLLDNYDSFTYNLLHLVEQFDGVEVRVCRNDRMSIEEAGRYDKLLLSPGPGLPKDAGILEPLIREYAGRKSILGICLGMQAIGEVFGASLFNLDKVQHGVANTTTITDEAETLFQGIPKQFKTGRYHSWMVSRENLPEVLEITSVDEQNNIMSLRHKTLDVRGVQFHPESILTEYGKELIGNWIRS
jgi:anthranilate synthase component 2